ncbi:hypothetical protein [Pseudomonas sp. NFACC04-2]|uniref:hypothetical protein n=1 Tax=Pseudomonas sp. NFACC04-2 TaxID=1566242 RepID=UPI0009087BE9|nr:hypothetical protein [Pseudomonas sp. NFACC04-2]SFW77426.1 hypothetical protein SAMN03159439_04653 [Pseudomonas sp. NFACC04-2]
MSNPKATITIHTTVGDPEVIYGAEYNHNPGERTFSQGVNDPGTLITRHGWLAVKTTAFPGWNAAYSVDVSDEQTGEDLTFEITRSFSYPVEKEEWLWFPVKSPH